MSKTLSRGLAGLVSGATAPLKPQRRAMTRALVAQRLTQRVTLATAGGPMVVETATPRATHGPWTFHDDEPETIRWLDELPPGDVLWDIGANIGVYALYAAIARGMKVLAFEPGAASYAALVRNIEINRLGGRIDAYCLAFDRDTRLDYLQMSDTGAGHSHHMFGAERPRRDAAAATTFRQAAASFAVDRFHALFGPPPPAHIKLDVDGIEAEIVEGAAATLAAHTRTILVEIEDAQRGRRLRDQLGALGFAEDVGFAAQGARRNVLFRREPAIAGTR